MGAGVGVLPKFEPKEEPEEEAGAPKGDAAGDAAGAPKVDVPELLAPNVDEEPPEAP